MDPHLYDPNVILSAGDDGRLLIWNIIKEKVMSNLIEEDSVLDAKWDPSGSTIAATNYDGNQMLHLAAKKITECMSVKTTNRWQHH